MVIYKHNVIDILRTLNKEEISRFKSFITSPYFNNHRTVILLYDEIIRYYPAFESRNLTKERLVSLVSPNHKDSTLRDAMSILFRLLLSFIGFENMGSRKFPLCIYTLRGLSERKLHNIYNKTDKNSGPELEKIKSESLVNFFLNSFYVNRSRFDELLQSRGHKNTKFNDILVQYDSFMDLVNHFLMQSFRIYYDLSTYLNIIDFDLGSSVIGKVFANNIILNLINSVKSDSRYSFINKIYYSLLRLRTRGGIREYRAYKNLVDKYSDSMNNDELIFHRLELIDFSIKRDSALHDNLIYAKELFGLYRYILDRGLYKYMSTEGSLIPELYLNIIINAIKLKEVKWLANFIKKYLNEVSASEKENMENLSYALLYNSVMDYNKSLLYARKIKEVSKNALKIRRVVIIRNFFELRNYETALKEITNFRALVRRTNILTDLEKHKLNIFTRLAEKIVLFRLESIGVNKLQILNEVREFKHSWFYKSWLLDKAKEL